MLETQTFSYSPLEQINTNNNTLILKTRPELLKRLISAEKLDAMKREEGNERD